MYQFFTEDYAGFSSQLLNWIAMGVCILVVVLLLLAIFRLFRGSSLGGGRRGRHARLAVTDATSIGDDRRKLVLIRRDNVEHLLLIGGSNDLVIETDIIRTAPQQTTARTTTAAPATTPTQPAAPVPAVTKPAEPPVAKAITPANPAPSPPKAAPAPVSSPAPAPATTVVTPTKVIAATAAAGAAIVSATGAEDASENETKTETDAPIVKAEVTSEPAPASVPEVTIDSPAKEAAADSAVKADPGAPTNAVDEMDALLNEITTEK